MQELEENDRNRNGVDTKELCRKKSKLLFKKIFSQLTNGCGRLICKSPSCAANPTFPLMNNQDAIIFTLRVMKNPSENFELCELVFKIRREEIKRLLETSEDNAADYVLSKFGHLATLETSFLKCDEKGNELYPKKENSHVDEDEIYETYNIILSNAKTSEALRKGLHLSSQILRDRIKGILFHSVLRVFFINFMNPLLEDPANELAVKNLVTAIIAMPATYKAVFTECMAKLTKKTLERVLGIAHQYISIEVLSSRSLFKEKVLFFLMVMDLIYESNRKSNTLSYKAFYNDAINESFSKKKTYLTSLKTERGKRYDLSPHFYIFDPSMKSRILRYESKREMNAEFGNAILSNVFGSRQMPYLRLVVQRDSIVPDTLHQLVHCSEKDFKKPLKVVFRGERGVDEGGVQKEFFQLIVRKLFLTEYGMFNQRNGGSKYWFNKDSINNHSEFELIGSIIGLAIYNGVILNLHFPDVVYQKLLNKPTDTLTFLRSLDPEMADGLQTLLDFDGDVEETFCRTFSVEYDFFGVSKIVDLKPNGRNVPLRNENREEYVNLYVNYVLNSSIKSQFGQFYKGFRKVCSTPFLNWLHWEELELLVCGSQFLDFYALQKSTRYQDGYTIDSVTIKMFWETLHKFSEEEKKKFLFFSTGSDRVPIKGLGDLILTISKNGENENRLPSAHTCFNHLLLPEYGTVEKLEEKLRLAIANSEGFGLL